MDTYSLPFVKGGEAFTLSKDRLTPRALAASIKAKNHILKTELAGTFGVGLPPEVLEQMRKDVTLQASIAQSDCLLFHALVALDPKVLDLGQEEVIRRLTVKQYIELVQAMGSGGSDKVVPAPLAETPAASTP